MFILASLGAQPRAPRMALSIIKIKKMKKKNFQPITDPRGDEQLAGASDPLSCCRAPSQPPPRGCYAKCHTAQNSPGSSFHLSLMGIPKPQRDSLENVPNLYLTKKCQVPEQRQSSKERRQILKTRSRTPAVRSEFRRFAVCCRRGGESQVSGRLR